MLECLKYIGTTMQKDVLTSTEATTLHTYKHVHIPLPTYVHSYVCMGDWRLHHLPYKEKQVTLPVVSLLCLSSGSMCFDWCKYVTNLLNIMTHICTMH